VDATGRPSLTLSPLGKSVNESDASSASVSNNLLARIAVNVVLEQEIGFIGGPFCQGGVG
jgi:hypothetical protein